MLVVSACATAAYMENGWGFGDAIYMVVLTVYTVGYDEVIPIKTPELRAITIALIVTGCTGMIFLTGSLIQLITASQLQQLFGFRRMQKDIDRLTDHVIICGYGRIGQMLARELQAGKCDFVVVERGDGRMTAARNWASSACKAMRRMKTSCGLPVFRGRGPWRPFCRMTRRMCSSRSAPAVLTAS